LAPAAFKYSASHVGQRGEAGAANVTPFQWIIRRQFLGFYYDSDAMYTDDADSLRLDDIATNVSQTQAAPQYDLHRHEHVSDRGEAPNDDGQAIQSIDMARRDTQGSRSATDSHPSPCRSRQRHAHLRRRGRTSWWQSNGD